MKNKIKIVSYIILFTLLESIFYIPIYASTFDSLILSDKVILTIDIGNDKGQVGYSDSMVGGGSGPEAFNVIKDNLVYVVDNVNKRINVYEDGNFVYDIDVSYITYVRSIVVSDDKIYLMDYDTGSIYIINSVGKLLDEIGLPEDMEYYLMNKLYVRNDGSVWLYYEDKCNNSKNCGENYSYLVNDLANDKKTIIEGYSKNGEEIFNINIKKTNTAYISSDNPININVNELVGSMQILNIDNSGSLYVDLYERINASKVCGEYTVRKYQGDECLGIAPIDLTDYYFMPNNILEVSENGDLYQIKCLPNKIQIIKKEFVPANKFTSKVEMIKEEVERNEADSSYNTRAIISAPNNRNTTMNVAIACCQLQWIYTNSNAINPNSNTVTQPTYLSRVSRPSTQEGIPYCWGGFDGLTTSSSTLWSNFNDAISRNAFAGNINTNTYGWQSGTTGLDCSGYVSSAAGFTYKLNTTDLASTTYTVYVSEAYRMIYDIYVKSNDHVLFYVGDTTSGIQTREATTTGDEKTKLYTRSYVFLSGYSLRRFHGW